MTEKSKRWRNHLIPDVFYEYDSEWYNVFHFDKKWIHAITWNKYDEEWFNQYWYSESWIDRNWFNFEGVHQITNDYFDEYWLDEYGFDKNWKFSIPNPHYPNSPFIPFNSDSNIYWYERDLFCEFSSLWIHKLTKTKYNEYGVDWKWCNNQGEFIWNKKCLTIINQIKKSKKDTENHSISLKDNEKKLNECEKELNLLKKEEIRYNKEKDDLSKEKEEYEYKYKEFTQNLLDFRENYYNNHEKEIKDLREKNVKYDELWRKYEEIKEKKDNEKEASQDQIQTLKNKSFSDYPQIKKIVSVMANKVSMQIANHLINLSYVIASEYRIWLSKEENDDFVKILKKWESLDIKRFQKIEEELKNIKKELENISKNMGNIEWKIQKIKWVIKSLESKIKELKNECKELEWNLSIEQKICKEKLRHLFFE